jgi:hypothetical protein
MCLDANRLGQSLWVLVGSLRRQLGLFAYSPALAKARND